MPEQVLHKGLTPERWNRFSLKQRLQMIESELIRASNLLQDSGDTESAKNCIFRAKELLDWTLGDGKTV